MKLSLNWGTGIALVYVAFAAATSGFVLFALERPVDLVSPDYYAESLRQDERMAAERNAREAGATLEQAGDRAIVLSLPRALAADARGTVTLYRPSDASADRVVQLKTDANGVQRVALDGVAAGAWTVRVRWTSQAREFSLEQRIVVR